jgi:hypothetical protein
VPDPGKDFQTKDLECELSHYTITAAGRLLSETGVDTDYHGYLELHEFRGETWWSYRAKFTDGQFQSIEIIESYTHNLGDEDNIVHYPPPCSPQTVSEVQRG